MSKNPGKKLHKVDKNKFKKNAKKFPELKMVVNGDYRSSNYTMSSDDEVFNFPPIKKMQNHNNNSGLKESSVASFSN